MWHIDRIHLLLRCAVICPVVGLLLPSGSLGAQPRYLPDDTTHLVADSARLATITTDTGAFAPGHRDFSHYDTPGLCRAAARWTLDLAQVSVAVQRSRNKMAISLGDGYPGSFDTTGTGRTAAVARACGAHFTLANTDYADGYDLFELALYQQDVALARAVLTQMVARATTTRQRDGLWTLAGRRFLDFGHLAVAESLTAQVIARGPSDIAAARELRRLLAVYYYRALHDTVRGRQENEAIIAADLGSPNCFEDVMCYLGIAYSYTDLMEMAVDGPATTMADSMAALAQRAKRDLSRFTDPTICRKGIFCLWAVGSWKKMTLSGAMGAIAPAWWREVQIHTTGYLRLAGKAPTLQADYWFPAPGSVGDTVRPVRGKVNLICMGGEPANSERIGNSIEEEYTAQGIADNLRRWHTLYGAAGLVVTVVHIEDGSVLEGKYYANHADEAQVWRWFYQTFEQLPMPLAVEVSHDQWLPPPDGRRVEQSVPNLGWMDDSTSHGHRTSVNGEVHLDAGGCTIIGRNGVALYKGTDNGMQEGGNEYNMYDVMLRWLFTGHDPSAATSVGMPGGMSPDTSSPRGTHR